MQPFAGEIINGKAQGLTNMCKCLKPKPTGKWSVRNGQSYATCECGGEYRTRLFNN